MVTLQPKNFGEFANVVSSVAWRETLLFCQNFDSAVEVTSLSCKRAQLLKTLSFQLE